MNYHVTSIIWLALEDYYNRGVTPEKAREIIESLTDPYSVIGQKLRCEEQGLNRNWNVRTSACCPQNIERVVWLVQDALEAELSKQPAKTKNKAFKPTKPKWRLRAFKRNDVNPIYDRLVAGFWNMCNLRKKWENQEFLHVLTWEANPSEIKTYRQWKK